MKPHIRRFQKKDAEEVSSLIWQTIFTVNIKDYSHDHLETIAAMYTPEKLAKNSQEKKIFIAELAERIVGTATIHNDYISCVFVLHNYIGKGIGKLLMETVENDARQRKERSVHLDSSTTAQSFYELLGYQIDVVKPGTIAMHKDLI